MPSDAWAVILAAGESARMGRPKALLPAAPGKIFLQQIADRCHKAGLQVIVVTGAHCDRILAAHPDLLQVFNPQWKKGQLSSVRGGLQAALAVHARRILVHPVDMPDVRADTFQKLMRSTKNVSVATCGEQTGHPLSLSASAAQALLTMKVRTLEEGIVRLGFARVTTDDPAVLENINSKAELQARSKALKAAARPAGAARSKAAARSKPGRSRS
jgi:molybdenum cofactor cytidylyltransferase